MSEIWFFISQIQTVRCMSTHP